MPNIQTAAGWSKQPVKMGNWTGPELVEAQNALINLGLYAGQIGDDPNGLAFKQAVANFQNTFGYGSPSGVFTSDMWYGLLYANDLVVNRKPLDLGVWNSLAGARQLGLNTVPDPNQWSTAPQGAIGVAPGTQIQGNVPGTSAPAPTAAPPAPTAAPDMTSAYAMMDQILMEFGLGAGSEFDLTAWARQQAKGPTYSSDVFKSELQLTDQYKTRFGNVNSQRIANGLSTWTPAQILEYETQAAGILKRAGGPSSFYDDWRDWQSAIAGGKSLAEINDDVEIAKAWSYSLPPEVKQAYAQITGAGDLQAVWAYVLDPTKAAPLLQHQLSMAEIMGAGTRFEIGVDQGMADTLANLGVNYERAQQGFAGLDATRGLFQESVGERNDLTLEGEGVAAAFGTGPGAQQAIAQRAAARQASLQGGGGAERNQRGVVGLQSVG